MPAEIDEEEGFLEFAKTKQKPRHGFRINEVKYQLLRTTEDGTYILKCKGGGAAVTLTERAVVLGTWQEKEKQTAAGCNQIIEKVAKHLIEHKF